MASGPMCWSIITEWANPLSKELETISEEKRMFRSTYQKDFWMWIEMLRQSIMQSLKAAMHKYNKWGRWWGAFGLLMNWKIECFQTNGCGFAQSHFFWQSLHFFFSWHFMMVFINQKNILFEQFDGGFFLITECYVEQLQMPI